MSEESPFDRHYWEDRYGEPGLTWSGNPNPVLVAEAGDLAPGRALDIGSGEGGDAIWLAARGWSVTGVDIAANALDKARQRAESIDPTAAARIDWQQRDLTQWAPDAQSYDLVSSQFMHLSDPARGILFRSLAAAVAPGGTLLIVGHDPSDADSGPHRGHLAELMFGVDDVLAAIDGEDLHVDVAESRARLAPNAQATTETHATHDTHDTVRDIVIVARRADSAGMATRS